MCAVRLMPVGRNNNDRQLATLFPAKLLMEIDCYLGLEQT